MKNDDNDAGRCAVTESYQEPQNLSVRDSIRAKLAVKELKSVNVLTAKEEENRGKKDIIVRYLETAFGLFKRILARRALVALLVHQLTWSR